MAKRTFRGGVHPIGHKELSRDAAFTTYLPTGEMVYLLGQHIGSPSRPIVKKGDRVLTGQRIAEASAYVSSHIASSCSGTVKAVEKRRSIAGTLADCIVVDNDGLYETVPGIGTKTDWHTLSHENILERIRDAGIIGMGGAGFPTHVKLTPKNAEDIRYVIANGAECEPYITCDDRLMREAPEEILEGLEIVLSLFPQAEGVVIIEDNKPEAAAAMQKASSGRQRIRILKVPVKYPQGGERSCISVVTGVHYESRQLPADVGCIVDNVGTLQAIYRAVCLSMPLIERGVTITGDAVRTPCNLMTRIGVSCEELLAAAGGLKEGAQAVKVLAGGPMMGVSFGSLKVPLQKNNNALTFLLSDEAAEAKAKQTGCIRCGRCVRVCPQGLSPVLMSDAYRKKDFERYENTLYGLECINCGSCTFICPARRPLMEEFKDARNEILMQRAVEQAKEAAEQAAREKEEKEKRGAEINKAVAAALRSRDMQPSAGKASEAERRLAAEEEAGNQNDLPIERSVKDAIEAATGDKASNASVKLGQAVTSVLNQEKAQASVTDNAQQDGKEGES